MFYPAFGVRRKDFNPRLPSTFSGYLTVREEVPMVNKPRRACSYVAPSIPEKGSQGGIDF